jgi:hypothetical protein
MPDKGAAVAVIVPLPVTPRLEPVPTSIAAVVFVPLVIPEKAEPPPDPQAAPVPMIKPPVLV